MKKYAVVFITRPAIYAGVVTANRADHQQLGKHKHYHHQLNTLCDMA